MFKNFAKIVAGSILIAAAVVATLPVAASLAFCGVCLVTTAGIDEMERR